MKTRIHKSLPFILTSFVLCFTACNPPELYRYVSEGCQYIIVYQYPSEDYFQYVALSDTTRKINYFFNAYVIPKVDSNEPLWQTIDCGSYGKYVPLRDGYNKNAIDTLQFCDFISKHIIRLDNNCFLYANHILSGELIYCILYNISYDNYCNVNENDTIRIIDNQPLKTTYRIPYGVITDMTGERIPTFRQLTNCINELINEGSIIEYEYPYMYYQ